MMVIVSDMKARIAALEAMLRVAGGAVETAVAAMSPAPKKAGPGRPRKTPVANEEKPKREVSEGLKAWHAFNARIDTLLKESESSFKRQAEAKQFASQLKKTKAPENWTDAEILQAHEDWLEQHPPTPAQETDVTVVAETVVAEKRGPGRPKKTPAVTPPEKKSSKLGAPPGAPKKAPAPAPRVAWEEPAALSGTAEAKLASAIQVDQLLEEMESIISEDA
jgi:hypothetical protein